MEGLLVRTAPGYPFSAILGMDDMRLALLLNAVSPAIGGVLVRGEKGTAKSTAVRALAALLPPVRCIAGCRFACDPARPDPACPDGPHAGAGTAVERPARLVELPVGAAEDRVVGSLDLEQALGQGVRAFEPGLLAAAHRGVLYVDEVNLLHDHLVDLLLDAAAMGRSHVEREGVSVSHAASFLLVGTMNPEEGELRPQLLDRFGVTVEVHASRDPEQRAEVVRRRLAADADPDAFAAQWRAADDRIAERVAAARAMLPTVVLPDDVLRQIAEVCAAFEVDGMRADIVTARAAVAHAAWHGHASVTAEDVRVAARLALPHRRRRDPFDTPGLDEDRLEEALRQAADDLPPDDDPDPGGPDRPPGGGSPPEQASASADDSSEEGDREPGPTGAGDHRPPAAPRQGLRARLITAPGIGDGVPGRRSPARTGHGRTTTARVPDPGHPGSLHLPATVRAAAPHQVRRGRSAGALRLRPADLREAVREGREGNLVLFVVDASGSMGARHRMEAVKGAVLALVTDAYQRRDKVAVIAFRGEGAQTLLPATSSVEAAVARLERLPTGGRTPLAEGLVAARDLLRTERLRDPRRRPLVLILTDGRATAGPRPLERSARGAALLAGSGAACVVIDCERGPVLLGLAQHLSFQLGADYHRLDDVAVDPLVGLARRRTGRSPGRPPRSAA
jgi:magnesium chelatase subunit D